MGTGTEVLGKVASGGGAVRELASEGADHEGGEGLSALAASGNVGESDGDEEREDDGEDGLHSWRTVTMRKRNGQLLQVGERLETTSFSSTS